MTESKPINLLRDHHCFGCGQLNVHGLRLRLEPAADTGGVMTRFTPDHRFEGYDGMVHGGIIATILDEVMAWALYGCGVWGVTAEMTIRFRKPVETGVALLAQGHLVGDRGRVLDLAGSIVAEEGGTLLATATASFMRVPEAQAMAWRERYATDTGESP